MHETVALSSVRRPMSPDHAAGDENGRLIQAVAIRRDREAFARLSLSCATKVWGEARADSGRSEGDGTTCAAEDPS